MERILINDETKKGYLQLATNVTKLYKAILPDPDAYEFTKICQLIHIIAQKIRNLTPPTDISGVMTEVEAVLDRSIAPEGYLIQIPAEGYDTEPIDLSQIDFEQLSERFNTQHKRLEAEKLRGAINSKLTAMIRLNRNRMDYQEKFEEMIAEYNAGTIGVSDYFQINQKSEAVYQHIYDSYYGEGKSIYSEN